MNKKKITLAMREASRGGLGLGCASLGNLYRAISPEQAAETIEAAWRVGIRYFDTAPYYGVGLSERRLGDTLRQYPRSEFVLSTKVGRLLEPDGTWPLPAERYGFVSPMPFKVRFDYSYDGIMRSFDASLQRLGLDRIDILLVHDIGAQTHGADASRHFADLAGSGYAALDQLRSTGAVGAIGLGVNETEVCLEAMAMGRWDCFLLAGRYTLLEQQSLHDFFPACDRHGAKVILGGVYNSGILATGTKGPTKPYYNYDLAPDSIVERVARIEALCAAHQVALASAALQFGLAHPAVASVIPGIGEPQRVVQAVAQAEERIPAAFWSDLLAAGLVDPAAPLPGARHEM